jgi:hypothetical protein
MSEPVRIAVGAVFTVALAYSLYRFVRWQRHPESVPRREGLGYALTGGAFLSLAIPYGLGVGTMLAWMPASWGTHTDDGEWLSLSFLLAMVAGIAAGGAALSLLEERTKLERELKSADEEIAIREAMAPAWTLTKEQRAARLETIRAELAKIEAQPYPLAPGRAGILREAVRRLSAPGV